MPSTEREDYPRLTWIGQQHERPIIRRPGRQLLLHFRLTAWASPTETEDSLLKEICKRGSRLGV